MPKRNNKKAVIPAKAGIQESRCCRWWDPANWIPAFAGMTDVIVGSLWLRASVVQIQTAGLFEGNPAEGGAIKKEPAVSVFEG